MSRWNEPVDYGKDTILVLFIWAFIIPLGIQVLLFLTYPFWERTWFGDWFLSF